MSKTNKGQNVYTRIALFTWSSLIFWSDFTSITWFHNFDPNSQCWSAVYQFSLNFTNLTIFSRGFLRYNINKSPCSLFYYVILILKPFILMTGECVEFFNIWCEAIPFHSYDLRWGREIALKSYANRKQSCKVRNLREFSFLQK